MNEAILQPIVVALWGSWLVIWMLAAGHVKTARWREPLASQLLHRGLLFLAAWLMIERGTLPLALVQRFVPRSMPIAELGVVLLATGMIFSVWARWQLGTNWSAAVTVKEDHVLIRTGPYRFVRHPIYSGLLLGVAGTALAVGEWRGLLALLFVLFALLYKIGLEERRMRESFPAYEQYRQETAALIPFVL